MYTDEQIRQYAKNINYKGYPSFCELCVIIRNTDDKTFLNEYETMLYNTRGMCTKCFAKVNDPNIDPAMENRIKIWEEETQLKVKK
jgi:hypothetical protein